MGHRTSAPKKILEAANHCWNPVQLVIGLQLQHPSSFPAAAELFPASTELQIFGVRGVLSQSRAGTGVA